MSCARFWLMVNEMVRCEAEMRPFGACARANAIIIMVTVDDAYVDVRGSAVMYFSFGKDNQSSFWLEHHMYV